MAIDEHREGAKLGKDQRAARVAAVAKADAWTTRQAERLGVTSAEIIDAVARGWLPADIEAAESKYYLESENNGLAIFRAQIRNAEVLPIKRKPPRPSNWNTAKVRHAEQVGSPNPAMAEAFAKAAAE